MTYIRKYLFLLFLCSFLFLSKCDYLEEFYKPQVDTILNYINANTNRVEKYHLVKIISADKKTDTVVFLKIEVESSPIKEICQGYVQYSYETRNFQIQTDSLKCTTNNEDTEHNKSTESSLEEPIIERRSQAPCLGCPIDLSTNADGWIELVDGALQHINSERAKKHALIQVLRIQRQIVNGVKYILLLEVAPTVCNTRDYDMSLENCMLDVTQTPEICEVQMIQRPWISKAKHIIANNCTVSQEFSTNQYDDSRDDHNNEIRKRLDQQSNTNDDTYPEEKLRLLTNQIIEDDVAAVTQRRFKRKTHGNGNGNNGDSSSSSSSSSSEEDNINNNGDKNGVRKNEIVKRKKATEDHIDDKKKYKDNKKKDEDTNGNNNNNGGDDDSSSSSSSEEDNGNGDNGNGEKGENGRHKKRSKRQVGSPQPVGVDDDEIRSLTRSTLLKMDAKSEHSNRYRIEKIISAHRQVVAGFLYKIRAEIALSQCPKAATATPSVADLENCGRDNSIGVKLCDLTIWERSWLQKTETNVTCDEGAENHHFRSRRHVHHGDDDYENNDDDDTESGESSDNDSDWNQFKTFLAQYDKTYRNFGEMSRRFVVFKANLGRIATLNRFERGTATYGITKFADLSYDEFRKLYTGYRRPKGTQDNEIPFATVGVGESALVGEMPREVDWRAKGAVTEVKDQGSCGSCWAFSTVGNVEGQYAIKHGKLIEFSEQELVDCDRTDDGCSGGLMDTAYRAIEKLGGLESEQDYPYDARGEKCHFDRRKSRVSLSGAVNVSQSEADMAAWLLRNGPIAIALNANAMQFYVGGVSHPFKFLCDPQNLDHGVLIVGYGMHANKFFNKTYPYWLIKNSWGKSWGQQGYYMLYRGDGSCGVNQTPSSAIVV